MTFSVAFEKRAHILPGPPPQFRQPNMPVVAQCGTVFIPTDWKPSDEIPRCRACAEAEVSRLWHAAEHYTSRAVALQQELNDDPANGFCGYHDRPRPCLECA